VVVVAQIRALCECEAGGAEAAAVVRGKLEAAAGEKMKTVSQEHRGYWCLLRAGAAAAARAPDGEVLGLLEEAASYGCWVPAGSRPVDSTGGTEGRLPEWEEFLGRMAMTAAADGDEQMEDAEDAGAGEGPSYEHVYPMTTFFLIVLAALTLPLRQAALRTSTDVHRPRARRHLAATARRLLEQAQHLAVRRALV
jgi:hypothetical protein